MKPIVRMLIMAMVIGAIGKYTSDLVTDDLRLRRRRSEVVTDELVVAARLLAGDMGLMID